MSRRGPGILRCPHLVLWRVAEEGRALCVRLLRRLIGDRACGPIATRRLNLVKSSDVQRDRGSREEILLVTKRRCSPHGVQDNSLGLLGAGDCDGRCATEPAQLRSGPRCGSCTVCVFLRLCFCPLILISWKRPLPPCPSSCDSFLSMYRTCGSLFGPKELVTMATGSYLSQLVTLS